MRTVLDWLVMSVICLTIVISLFRLLVGPINWRNL